MALQYPSAAGFAQSVCQRRRALSADVALVVVEGQTDRRALLPFVDTDVVVVSARGKANATAAHRRVNTEGLSGVLVLIDCDGDVPSTLKGLPDLIVSANRDLEADLLLELNALRRFAIDVLGDSSANLAEAESRAASVLERALGVGAELERIRQAARAVGARTRLVDVVTGQKRKVRPRDLPQVQAWLASPARPAVNEVAKAYGRRAGWSPQTLALVAHGGRASAATACAVHAVRQCGPCDHRALCEGHALVELVAQALGDEAGHALDVSEVERALRIASDRDRLTDWCVCTRGRRWAAATGVRLFSS